MKSAKLTTINGVTIMTRNEIVRLIDAKIRQHEIRVGLISGVLGLLWLSLQATLTIALIWKY